MRPSQAETDHRNNSDHCWLAGRTQWSLVKGTNVNPTGKYVPTQEDVAVELMLRMNHDLHFESCAELMAGLVQCALENLDDELADQVELATPGEHDEHYNDLVLDELRLRWQYVDLLIGNFHQALQDLEDGVQMLFMFRALAELAQAQEMSR